MAFDAPATGMRYPVERTAILNLIRAFAAMWVAVAHSVMWSGGSVPDYLEPKKAVALFMVVSGFLMFHTIDRRADRDPPERWTTWRAFYIRRYFRIAPAYYLALATVLLAWPAISPGITSLQALNPARWSTDTVYGAAYQDLSPTSILLHLTFLFGLSPSLSFSDALPDWSLSLEMQFYAAFPLIYLLARRRFMLTCGILSILCILITREYAAAVEAGRLPAFDEPSLLLFNLPTFLVGALIYEAGRTRRIAPLGLAAIILLAVCRWYGAAALPLAAIILGLALAWFNGLPARLERLFDGKIVKWMAETSYSLYLFHGLVIFILGPELIRAGLGGPLFVLIIVGITLAIASTVYFFVERTGNALGALLTGRRQATAPPMA